MYSDPRVIEFIQEHFSPVRAHVRENAEEYKRLAARFNAQWTPTTLIVDAEGKERQLAHAAFARGRFGEAEPLFRMVVDRYPDTEAAPEALYWAGVSRYKANGDAGALGDTARAFSTRYTDTSWAKKASVWSK